MINKLAEISTALQIAHADDTLFIDIEETLIQDYLSEESVSLPELRLPEILMELANRKVNIVYMSSLGDEALTQIKSYLKRFDYPNADIVNANPELISKADRLEEYINSISMPKNSKVMVISNDVSELQEISDKLLNSQKLKGNQNHLLLYNYTPASVLLLCENHPDEYELNTQDLEGVQAVTKLGGANQSTYKITLEDGTNLVLKHTPSADNMQAEVLSLSSSHALGLPIPKAWYLSCIPESLSMKLGLKTRSGNFLVSRFVEGNLPSQKEVETFVKKYYILQGLLGNTDLLKSPYDKSNLVSDNDDIYAIDFGANIFFYPEGAAKDIDDSITELDILKLPSLDKYVARVYSSLNNKDLKTQVQELQKRTLHLDRALKRLEEHFPHLRPICLSFKDVLSARMDVLSARYSPDTSYAKMDKPVKFKKTAAGILSIVSQNSSQYVLLGKRRKEPWWDNFGGKSEKHDRDLGESAIREALEETSFALGLSSHKLDEAPSHDLITLEKDGKVAFTYRMYIDLIDEQGAKLIQLDHFKDAEHTEYRLIPLDKLLTTLFFEEEIEHAGSKTIKVGDTIIFPPLYDMLRQRAVYTNLLNVLGGEPLRISHTQGHKNSPDSEEDLYDIPNTLERVPDSTRRENKQKAEALIKHQRLMREIKLRKQKNSAHRREKPFDDTSVIGPSEMHLKVLLGNSFNEASLSDNVRKALDKHTPFKFADPSRKERLIPQIAELITNEKQANKIMLYHGSDEKAAFAYRVFSIFYKAAHIDARWNAFRGVTEPFVNFANMSALINHFSEGGTIDIDNYKEGYADLSISTNIFLFGNHETRTSNSLYYYLSNTTRMKLDLNKLFEHVFLPLGVKKETLARLMYLYNKYAKSKGGSLYQIAIRKTDLGEIVYPAGNLGILNEYDGLRNCDEIIKKLKQDLDSETSERREKARNYIQRLQARLLVNPEQHFDITEINEQDEDTIRILEEQIQEVIESALYEMLLADAKRIKSTLPLYRLAKGMVWGNSMSPRDELLIAVKNNDEKYADRILSANSRLKDIRINLSFSLGMFGNDQTSKDLLEFICEQTSFSYDFLVKHFEEKTCSSPYFLEVYIANKQISPNDKLRFILDMIQKSGWMDWLVGRFEAREHAVLYRHFKDVLSSLTSAEWYALLQHQKPNLKTHFLPILLEVLNPEFPAKIIDVYLERCPEFSYRDLPRILKFISEDDRLTFVDEYLVKCHTRDIATLGYILNYLPKDKKLEFSKKYIELCTTNSDAPHMDLILQNLRVEERLEVANNILAKFPRISLIELEQILSKLNEENERLQFTIRCFEKLKKHLCSPALPDIFAKIPAKQRFELANKLIDLDLISEELFPKILEKLPKDMACYRYAMAYIKSCKKTNINHLNLIITSIPPESKTDFLHAFLEKVELEDTCLPYNLYRFVNNDQMLIIAFAISNKITTPEVNDMVILISNIPKQSRFKVADTLLEKCEKIGAREFYRLLSLLHKEDRPQFLIKFVHKSNEFSTFALSLFLAYVPDVNKVSFAFEYLAKCDIVDTENLASLVSIIPRDEQIKFIDKYLEILTQKAEIKHLSIIMEQLKDNVTPEIVQRYIELCSKVETRFIEKILEKADVKIKETVANICLVKCEDIKLEYLHKILKKLPKDCKIPFARKYINKIEGVDAPCYWFDISTELSMSRAPKREQFEILKLYLSRAKDITCVEVEHLFKKNIDKEDRIEFLRSCEQKLLKDSNKAYQKVIDLIDEKHREEFSVSAPSTSPGGASRLS